MKNIVKYFVLLILMISSFNMNAQDGFAQQGYKYDSITTTKGRTVNLIFIKHGSIALEIDGFVVYIDPVTMFGNDFSVLPKTDMLLVTHEHGDHYDPKAINLLLKDKTVLLISPVVANMRQEANTFKVGDTYHSELADFTVTATPAYNNTEGHLNFHPKERGDVGFVFDIDGLKIYVAGDTEDIAEMQNIGDIGIDIAFLPINQPYTMTVEQTIHAIEMLRPKVVYPYHYGNTNLEPLIKHFNGSDVDIRVRELQ